MIKIICPVILLFQRSPVLQCFCAQLSFARCPMSNKARIGNWAERWSTHYTFLPPIKWASADLKLECKVFDFNSTIWWSGYPIPQPYSRGQKSNTREVPLWVQLCHFFVIFIFSDSLHGLGFVPFNIECKVFDFNSTIWWSGYPNPILEAKSQTHER